MNDIVDRYVATWNSTSREERDGQLAEHWSSDVTYVDPLADVRGHAELSELIDGVREQFPTFTFSPLGEVDAHHQQARFRWALGPADGEPLVVGFDVIVLDDDGRIRDVRGFLDKVPA
ncbi:nuclear transport factor 2 family protein [Georgenia halophila]|uniref:Nuclear transport factor 2 family protein n=1 Tax=Georgenia halophila TaxID=620889 RepID=A0ABP8LFX6_9MICO